eukprot:4241703-Pyramimonas_sp.AAC.1
MRSSLEQNFPTYSEASECSGLPSWGELKLGRLSLHDDARTGVGSSAQGAPGEAQKLGMSCDGATFKAKCNNALQYFMCRCQHHIHRLVMDSKTKQEK